MKRVTNSDLAETLGDIREDLGSIKAQLESHSRAFDSHVKSDVDMASDIKQLQLKSANSAGIAKGRTSVVGLIGALAGAGASFAVEWFKK